MMRGRLWTDEEDQALRDGIAGGKSREALAMALKRTKDAIECRLVDLKRTPEERAALRRMKRKAQPKTIKMKIERARNRPPVVPEDVLQEMIRRMTTPRSITAVLMGDPPFPATPANPRVLA